MIAIGNDLNVKISEFLSKDKLGLLAPEKRNSFFKDLNDKNILPPNLANDLKRVVILTGHDLYNKSLPMELLPHKLAVSTYNYLEKDEVKKAAFAKGQMGLRKEI